MKILAFAASNSRQSINKALVTHVAGTLQAGTSGAELEVLDLNDFEMPIYSMDREMADGIPDQAHAFFNKIGAADVVLISYAEHNGSYTAAYKNVFDWASRINMQVFQNKPMLVMSASPGPGGASSVLGSAVGSAGFFGADIKDSFSVASFGEVYDTDTGAPVDEDLKSRIEEAVNAIAQTADQQAA